jgi:hypothetical protein
MWLPVNVRWLRRRAAMWMWNTTYGRRRVLFAFECRSCAAILQNSMKWPCLTGVKNDIQSISISLFKCKMQTGNPRKFPWPIGTPRQLSKNSRCVNKNADARFFWRRRVHVLLPARDLSSSDPPLARISQHPHAPTTRLCMAATSIAKLTALRQSVKGKAVTKGLGLVCARAHIRPRESLRNKLPSSLTGICACSYPPTYMHQST